MVEFAETPIVLATDWRGRDLVVRIDSNLWESDLALPTAVRVLTLHDASILSGETTAGWAGHHIHVNESEDGSVPGTRLVEIYIDYAVDYIEVTCRATSEEQVAYSGSDLAAKFAAVAEVARTYAEQSGQLERELNRLRGEVGSKIDRELDVGERKRQFFAASHPERAQAIQGHLKFLQQVREKLAQ